MGNSTSRREFTRSVDLPSDIQVNLMRSVFSRDGVLSITAPIKPPHYDSVSGHNSSYRGFVFSNIIADRYVCQHFIHVYFCKHLRRMDCLGVHVISSSDTL